MNRPKFFIETAVPMHRRDGEEGEGPKDSRPQIRRHLERICQALNMNYEDVVELHLSYNRVTAVYYDRNEAGELYRDEFNKVATKQIRAEVDTFTYLGDETEF